MTELVVDTPLEAPRHAVGRRTVHLVDPARSGRNVEVDLWYPAAAGTDGRASHYTIIPGVEVRSALAHHDAIAMPGRWPVVLFSHGRTGTRISYSMLCEALAARGAVVVSADHPGDRLADWLAGTASDDRTNETDRVADAHLVLHALLHGHEAVPVDILNAVDPNRVVAAGHSYGAYTALAAAAGARGVAPHERIRAVAVLQPYTRSLSDGALGRVRVPTLLVVSAADETTPPSVDADRPWALIPGRPLWRLDLAGGRSPGRQRHRPLRGAGRASTRPAADRPPVPHGPGAGERWRGAGLAPAAGGPAGRHVGLPGGRRRRRRGRRCSGGRVGGGLARPEPASPLSRTVRPRRARLGNVATRPLPAVGAPARPLTQECT